jgi:hypothetical protein
MPASRPLHGPGLSFSETRLEDAVRPVRLSLYLLVGLLACADSTGPAGDLAGSWLLVGYTDAGVPAAASGTATFLSVGTFTIEGTLTFPGEPPDPIQAEGTWSADGDVIVLTTGGQTGRWAYSASGEEVTLTLEGSQPATTMTLRRA